MGKGDYFRISVSELEANKMTTKILPESVMESQVIQTLDKYRMEIQEKAPNLSIKDYSTLVYLVTGYHLGKCNYFGLKFPLEDGSLITELCALSNGYLEIKDGVVRMGVLNLENLNKILASPYLSRGSVHIE
jgi:hypothetical protein